jgi:predicted AlkP superfamily pyrophosphatase or phosphodiesterase
MKSSFKCIGLLICLCAAFYGSPLSARQPDLVLMITIDQLRGEMPRRFEQRLGPAGFRYFFDHGTVYPDAHFKHLVTSTAAGHATLFTGAHTPEHGMAGNDWYDISRRQRVYNTEDRQHPVLGVPAAPAEGRSPRQLTSSTVGDELVKASGGKSRVFAVSLKDRAAIIPGGQLGKAFWYSDETGRFVTSTYYYPVYPQWVIDWNAAGYTEQLRNQNWELLRDRGSYVFRDHDDRWFEKPAGMLGRTFPHPLANPDDLEFYSALRSTPMADQLTLSFVKALVEAENIGSAGHTDMLAVSFSATDYIGHDFGPNSLEAEDNLLRLDQTLQELLGYIDEQVGLDNTLVVLSADHGVATAPERMAAMGAPVERTSTQSAMQRGNRALRARFAIESDLVIAFVGQRIYLDESTIRDSGIDLAEAERALAEEITRVPGYYAAFGRSDLQSGALPDTELVKLAARSMHPLRSGHVIVVQDPFWYMSDEPEGNAATHGSPWAYDTHVPIMIAGPGILNQRVVTRVAPSDIAPTISAYLEIPRPSGATGNLLPKLMPGDGGGDWVIPAHTPVTDPTP